MHYDALIQMAAGVSDTFSITLKKQPQENMRADWSKIVFLYGNTELLA